MNTLVSRGVRNSEVLLYINSKKMPQTTQMYKLPYNSLVLADLTTRNIHEIWPYHVVYVLVLINMLQHGRKILRK